MNPEHYEKVKRVLAKSKLAKTLRVDSPEKVKDLCMFLSGLSKEQRSQIKLKSTSSGGGCFIATAACGTDQAEDVIRLRAYRDTVLQQTTIGRGFIEAYEAISPPLAQLISKSALARSLVRSLIVHHVARRIL